MNFRNSTAYIRYLDQHGKLVRESTGQRSAKFAEDLLAKRRTGQHTRSRFEYHLPKIRERFADRRAHEINADSVEEFLHELEHDGFAASSVNKYRTILCSTFNFALRRHKYDLNPVSAVHQRKEPPGQDRFLSAGDFRKLVDECKSDPVLHAFVWIAATTGDRKGTASDTAQPENADSEPQVLEKNGGDDGARTRDLRRDRPAF